MTAFAPSASPYLEALAHSCDEGYDFINAVAPTWKAVAGWGADGWDLLDWPYYIAFVSDSGEFDKPYGLMTYCEGDISEAWFPSAAARETAINELALAHWTRQGETWVTSEPAERLRGPYRRDRS